STTLFQSDCFHIFHRRGIGRGSPRIWAPRSTDLNQGVPVGKREKNHATLDSLNNGLQSRPRKLHQLYSSMFVGPQWNDGSCATYVRGTY
ncbi:unnamed protein product, partial [Larinioides sclopetarius]